jgi:hypothetical protein
MGTINSKVHEPNRSLSLISYKYPKGVFHVLDKKLLLKTLANGFYLFYEMSAF